MARSNPLDAKLAALVTALAPWKTDHRISPAIERFTTNAAATRFHLIRQVDARPIVTMIGGTGTGKSTLFNRLIGAQLTATSFLRTFTAGPVVAAQSTSDFPAGWLSLQPTTLSAEQLPASGTPDALMLIPHESELLRHISLVDTPDLDGDKIIHHAQADRAFRWADAVVFVVTPEKYQMTELLPYYRLANRYGLVATFVMNKVERNGVAEDFARQLRERGDVATDQAVPLFTLARDDAGFEPPVGSNLQALRARLSELPVPNADARAAAMGQRLNDLIGRAQDQIINPMRAARAEVDRLIQSLQAMETPAAGVDVNPLTDALQRRLQQRSILYLMGPGRMLDRVRQVPGILARLPRSAWDILRGGKPGDAAASSSDAGNTIDFRAALVDQFTIVQSHVDDVVRSSTLASEWVADPAADYGNSRLPVAQAAGIADEEIASLQHWMGEQWNATPRDTAILKKLLKMLPGGEKLTAWSEAAPYILAIVVAAHHAIFGPVDLMVMGGFSLATWLTEKVSNEVTSRARLTNRKIATRFERLSHQQIVSTCAWLQRHAPTIQQIESLQKQCDQLQENAA